MAEGPEQGQEGRAFKQASGLANLRESQPDPGNRKRAGPQGGCRSQGLNRIGLQEGSSINCIPLELMNTCLWLTHS